MNKSLTEKESKVADLFLEFLLTIETNHAFKNVVNTFFIKHNISKERTLFICKYLEIKSLISLILDSKLELRNLNIDKSKIKDFLKNDSVHKIWLTRNKLHNDSKLSDWQLKSFWPLFVFGIFGGIYSAYDFIKNQTKEEKVQSKPVTKEEMESELFKLRTLILKQKNDSSLVPAKFKKGNSKIEINKKPKA